MTSTSTTPGTAQPDIIYQFRFTTRTRDEETFLYNVGPITSLDSRNWNRRQFYTVTRIQHGKARVLGAGLACPPCNIGPLSTPHYGTLAAQAIHTLGDIKVFAGQRAEGFYVDLGSIFDLADLRPFQTLHDQYGMPTFSEAAPGVNATNRLNVHSIAIQVPTWQLTRTRNPRADDPRAVIGVWTTASRQKVRVWDGDYGRNVDSGPFRQVSRLGNPLVNEVLIPLGKKDRWNTLAPSDDKIFASYFANPELAGLLPVLYPGVFPHLAGLVKSGQARADLEAILLTGIPPGIIPGFQNNMGSTLADMLRLNTAIPPAHSPNILGLIGGDAAGFPNGRRVSDDVVTIELRAIAGVTYPLIDKKYRPDKAAGEITDGLTPRNVKKGYLASFPYLGSPYGGYYNPS
jgi:hypothetical protein